MKLGIGTDTYGWAVGVRGQEPPHPLDEHGLLDKAQSLDINLVQIGDNLPLHEFTSERLTRLAERAKSDGFTIEIGARRLTVERIAEYLTIAQRLNATLLRFVVDDTDYHPSLDTIVGILRESVPHLGEITLALENNDRFSAASLRTIIGEVDHAQIGICLDTANSLGACEGLDTVLEMLACYTVNLHLKEVAIERLPHLMGFQIAGRPFETGVAGIARVPKVLARLKWWNRCHSAILEQWTPPETSLDATIAKEAAWAEKSVAYLRPYFD